MKLSHIVKLSLFLSCALLYAQPTLPMWPRTAQTPEEQHEGLRKIADRLNQVTLDVLINCMQTLETNLTYWRKMLSHPGYHKFLRGPQGWFDAKNSTTLIKGYIKELEALEKQHAEALGSLYNDLQEKEDIHWHVYVNNSFKRAPLPCSTDTGAAVEELPTAYLEACTTLLKKITKVRSYQATFEQAIEPYRQPSHLGRHWWKYAIGGAAAAAAGGYLYKHQDEIPKWAEKTSSAIKTKWQEHVTDPLKGIWKNLSPKNNAIKEKSLEDMNKKMEATEKLLEEAKQIAAAQEKTFGIIIDSYVDAIPKLSNEERQAMRDAIKQGNDSGIQLDINNQIQRPGLNYISDLTLGWGSKEKDFHLSQAGLALLNVYKNKIDQMIPALYEAKLDGLKIEHQIKQQWHLQEVNTMIAAMIPALILTYGTYKVSNTVFNKLLLKKGVYIPLHHRMEEIIRLLNKTTDSEGKVIQFSLEENGRLRYNIATLKKYISLIPRDHRDNFEKNIQELEQKKTVQERRVIAKMMLHDVRDLTLAIQR